MNCTIEDMLMNQQQTNWQAKGKLQKDVTTNTDYIQLSLFNQLLSQVDSSVCVCVFVCVYFQRADVDINV